MLRAAHISIHQPIYSKRSLYLYHQLICCPNSLTYTSSPSIRYQQNFCSTNSILISATSNIQYTLLGARMSYQKNICEISFSATTSHIFKERLMNKACIFNSTYTPLLLTSCTYVLTVIQMSCT